VSEALRVALLAAADALEAARDELSRLDAHAGDGDHGVTMTLAARAVRQRVLAAPDASDADLIGAVAQAVASVGGAIGPLYAAALMRVGAVLRRAESEPAGISVTALLSECAEAAEASVSEFGGAKPGAKTVLDALHPAVEALRAAEADGLDPRAAIARAADAARAGADATTDMVATVGRASRFGERSRGAPDPGAMSLAVILGAMAAALPAIKEGGVPRA
jgi:dihydroxyacetone kinase